MVVDHEVPVDDVAEVQDNQGNEEEGQDLEGNDGPGVSATLKAAPSKWITKAKKCKAEVGDIDNKGKEKEEASVTIGKGASKKKK